MAEPVKIVHYINQFFGGLGGEEKANVSPIIQEGLIGPGKVLQQAVGDDGIVVATIVAGDNYVVEERDSFDNAIADVIQKYSPDVIVAGPAFEAGRYGFASAEACRSAQSRGIPAITGMYPDNPGVMTYRSEIFCVPTGTSPTEMGKVMQTMARLALKLGRGEPLGPSAEEGYLPRGVRRFVMRDRTGAERAADLLRDRITGKNPQTEIYLKKYEVVNPPPAISTLENKTVALVTTGAITPTGNPDRMPSLFATEYHTYSIDGLDELNQGDWESVHAGFNTNHINDTDPNYALPLSAARVLESEGVIGKVYPYMFSLPGVATAVRDSEKIGSDMAHKMKEGGVDAVLLTAT